MTSSSRSTHAPEPRKSSESLSSTTEAGHDRVGLTPRSKPSPTGKECAARSALAGARSGSPLGGQTEGPQRSASADRDEELIDRVLAKDRASAAALYDLLLPVVDRTLRRVLGHREEDHDDLVQQSFEHIIKTLVERRFVYACSLKTWASTLTARLAFSELRRRCRRRRWVTEEPLDLERVAAGDWTENASLRVEVDQLRRALSSLKPERAIVVYLHDVEGHRLADICVMLGLSLSAAQSRLVRGRTQLLERHSQLETSQDVDTPPRVKEAP